MSKWNENYLQLCEKSLMHVKYTWSFHAPPAVVNSCHNNNNNLNRAAVFLLTDLGNVNIFK